MKNRHRSFCSLLSAGLALSIAAPAATLYNNLTPNSSIAVASRPGTSTTTEIEAADDFVLNTPASVTSASFDGLIVPGTGSFGVTDVVVEIYRVFPLDSNTARTPQVPTRANSPSDVALADRDSAVAGQLAFTDTVLAASFTVLNSIQPGGIHAFPNQNTGGSGAVTGQEIQFDVTFSSPFNLPADHYFFVPQVSLSNGAQFYWLSASRPISGAGTTPFAPDLQMWTRDQALSPDWLRVGSDIVGGTTPPTFNGSFAVFGTATPEPSTAALLFAGAALVSLRGLKRRPR